MAIISFTTLFGKQSQIFVSTTKPSYYAGEIVEGTVALSLLQPLQVEGIFLKVKGYQLACFEKSVPIRVRDANGLETTRYETKTFAEKKVFFRNKLPLFHCNSVMMPGNHMFTFRFPLQAGLPSSFEEHGSGYNAKVLYKVKAEVAVPGFFKANIKHSQVLTVNETLQKQLTATTLFKEGNVTFLCCISKGKISMLLNFDKNAYAPGDTVNLHVVVDNSQSEVNLEAVSLKLVQSLSLYAQGQEFSKYETVCKGVGGPVPKGTKDERTIILPLPGTIMPSCTSSGLVRNRYFLEVSLRVPWSPNMRLKEEFQIYIPQIATYVPFTPPPDWAPVRHDTVVMQAGNYASY